ncbi:MAG: VWA domain-containing protein, partial [Thermoguttaceae bacterium]|nr:VWA domain-containing protein [Thermoguttaceae bacterium]
MSQFCRFRLLALCAFALSAGMFSGEAQAVPQADQVAELSVCEQDGAKYFSLRIPPVQSEAAASHDVVIVLNTSATMNGSNHAAQKQALEGVLSRLGTSDRVQIVTADIDAKPLTQGFVAANSPEATAAVQAFETTTSLGATDLPKAIETSVAMFDEADPAAARSVLFIGDGRSRANLPDAETLAALTETCVENQVAVSSLGLGVDVDSSLLEAIAGRTGGCFLAAESVDSTKLDDALVAAVTGPVVHVGDAVVPEGVTLYPTTFPPLRADRSTVLIGKANAGSLDQLKVTATAADGSELAWNAEAKTDANNAFLVKLVQGAEVNGGVALPLSDSSSLQAVSDQFQQSAVGVAAMAQVANEMGDTQAADALVDTAKTVMPNLKLAGPQGGEVVALTPVKTVAPLGSAVTDTSDVAATPATTPAPVVATPATDVAVPATDTVGTASVASSDDADTLDMSGTNDPMSMDYYEGTVLNAAQQQELQTAQVKTAVEVALADAAKLIRQDPVSAQMPLKVLLPQIRGNTTIDAATRQRLVANIEAKLREASAQEEVMDAHLQVERRKQANARHRATVAEDLLRKEKKVDQLSERYRALINEKNYRVAEEDVGAALAVVSPDSVIATHAIGSAQSQGYWADAMALRRLRQKGVIDTLYQVEKAYVPFPDEPPLVYPDATTWRLLSDRRKKQAEELKTITGASETEKRIYTALRQPIELRDLTPDDEGKILLSEVLDAVKAECGIEVVLDTKEIDTAGEYDSNSTVTLVKNITLRSALNVMLREYGLKYVVKDEVLLITTADAIESKPDSYLNLRVYPVADLVVPIMSGGMGGMMGGMGGGMMGGMGGGMMGGMGGGMMGG